jgi:hypothetical protein
LKIEIENMTDLKDIPTPPPAVLAPGHTFASVTDKISSVVLTEKLGKGWMTGVAICTLIVMIFTGAVGYLFAKGVGIWGINIPIA